MNIALRPNLMPFIANMPAAGGQNAVCTPPPGSDSQPMCVLQAEGVGGWPADVIPVDGVPFAQLRTWFGEADGGSKGFVTPAEAVVFFKRTGLPKESLSRVS